jgi:hypothetical protein
VIQLLNEERRVLPENLIVTGLNNKFVTFSYKNRRFITVLKGASHKVSFLIQIKRVHTPTSHFFAPLNPKLVKITFKNSVRTAKKTQHFTVAKINWLTPFKK